MRELTAQERMDIVRYRIENARCTLDEVRSHIGNGFYNTAVNRMYYACYYAVCALLIAHRVVTKSHEGVMRMFGLHFVKTGIVPEQLAKDYARLFSKRTTGDYEDLYNNDAATCEDLYPKAQNIVDTVGVLVQQWLDDNEQQTSQR